MSPLVWTWTVSRALAGVHVLEEGQTVSVPLNLEVGTVLQLPSPIQLVTPTAHVLLERVDDSAPVPKGGPPPAPRPVQHLRARVPDGTAPVAELVTIVLADGAAVPIRFVPTPGADPFADLQRPKAKEEGVFGQGGFLTAERELMLAMLKDEPYRREAVDEEMLYEQYPELAWHLRRRFRGDGVTGYVFVLTNTTKKDTLRLDAAVLAVDQPNRAMLVQMDDEVLSPCGRKGEGGPCQTVLRLVVVEPGAPVLSAPALQRMPFVRVASDTRRP
jgi:hypothetical protein